MRENELEYYSKIANWDFSSIKCETDFLTDWNYFEEIKKHTNERSLCLDLGTGGGEKVLKYYPKVRMIIATDFSKEMVYTAKENAKKYPERNVKLDNNESNGYKWISIENLRNEERFKDIIRKIEELS